MCDMRYHHCAHKLTCLQSLSNTTPGRQVGTDVCMCHLSPIMSPHSVPSIWLARLRPVFSYLFVFCLFLSISVSLSICVSLVLLWHFEASLVIQPSLPAPRGQLALLTPCSQHTIHNPAPVMETTLRCFQKAKERYLYVLFRNLVLITTIG